jgi:hypothetical protein
MELRTLSLLAF